VVRQPCLRGRFRTRSPTTIAPTIRSGGRKPPWTLFHIRTRRAEVHCICRHRLQYHGGLTLAALVNMRSPIAKIAFLPADARTATRSGGRQPPVVRQPCLQGRFRTRSPRPSHRQPGAGGVSPPWITKTRLQRRSPNTRETADAAPENLIAIAAARITARLLRFAILLTCASSSHGGLTPAALVHVRLYIANGALCSARTSRTKSGRCKPTVENVRDCTSVSNTTAGSRPPLWCSSLR
jgi:hypothetical protein